MKSTREVAIMSAGLGYLLHHSHLSIASLGIAMLCSTPAFAHSTVKSDSPQDFCPTAYKALFSSSSDSIPNRKDRVPGTREAWAIDGPAVSHWNTYEESMADLFEKLGIQNSSRNYFQGLIATRKSDGKRTDVLDLLGSGFFLPDPGAARSVTGIRLSPYDFSQNAEGIDFLRKHKPPTEVIGDVFDPTTWSSMDASMSERGISKFHLVVMRPEGGWEKQPLETAEDHIKGLTFILEQVLARLAQDGQFYFLIERHSVYATGLAPTPQILALQKHIAENTGFRLEIFDGKSTMGAHTTYGGLFPKSSK